MNSFSVKREENPKRLDRILRVSQEPNEPANILTYLPSYRVPWQHSFQRRVQLWLRLARPLVQARDVVRWEGRETSRQPIEKYQEQV